MENPEGRKVWQPEPRCFLYLRRSLHVGKGRLLSEPVHCEAKRQRLAENRKPVGGLVRSKRELLNGHVNFLAHPLLCVCVPESVCARGGGGVRVCVCDGLPQYWAERLVRETEREQIDTMFGHPDTLPCWPNEDMMTR